jgi:hypothetical protein
MKNPLARRPPVEKPPRPKLTVEVNLREVLLTDHGPRLQLIVTARIGARHLGSTSAGCPVGSVVPIVVELDGIEGL